MNKKQRRQKLREQKQKRRNTTILLAIGGFMLVFAAILFARQGGGDGSGTPSISVDQQRIDYGDQHFGTNLTFAVKVSNTGDGTLRFKEKPYIQVLEGC
ncbi:MAG TPA: hypothetical protein VK851_10260 [Anaerolineales bacterium]|nr:hypothetical protein [Anaerolineales bacterium]